MWRDKVHVFNQEGSHKFMGEFDVLCDNQSTCDVIVNKNFVENSIRKCSMTLILQTHAGLYRINKVSDLPGVAIVWFYPEGVSSILLQHGMVMIAITISSIVANYLKKGS